MTDQSADLIADIEHLTNAGFGICRAQAIDLITALRAAETENYELKLAAAGGEDVPGSAAAVTPADVERWVREWAQIAEALKSKVRELETDKARLLDAISAIDDLPFMEINLNNYDGDDVAMLNDNATQAALIAHRARGGEGREPTDAEAERAAVELCNQIGIDPWDSAGPVITAALNLNRGDNPFDSVSERLIPTLKAVLAAAKEPKA